MFQNFNWQNWVSNYQYLQYIFSTEPVSYWTPILDLEIFPPLLLIPKKPHLIVSGILKLEVGHNLKDVLLLTVVVKVLVVRTKSILKVNQTKIIKQIYQGERRYSTSLISKNQDSELVQAPAISSDLLKMPTTYVSKKLTTIFLGERQTNYKIFTLRTYGR